MISGEVRECIGVVSFAGVIATGVALIWSKEQYKQESQYSQLSAICTIAYPVILIVSFLYIIYWMFKLGEETPPPLDSEKRTGCCVLGFLWLIATIASSISFGFHCHHSVDGCKSFLEETIVYMFVWFYMIFLMSSIGILIFLGIFATIGEYCERRYNPQEITDAKSNIVTV